MLLVQHVGVICIMLLVKQEILITRPPASSGATCSNEEKQHFRPIQFSEIVSDLSIL